MSKYKLVLGLEIHLQPRTEQKMFCGCSGDIWGMQPNTNTCPVCLGLPGALPVPNLDAVHKTQLLGLALGCTLNKDSKFDRKHYFYPDLPKGYQISQYKEPLCLEGMVELESGNTAKIERIHLEEDVAKSIHKNGKTMIDFNKSSMPLIEIVSHPCFENTEDAVDYCKKIQYMVRFLDLGTVDMEKGQMRLEANISLQTPEQAEKNELPPYKVEVKNINSFRFMEKAVKAEIKRQTELLDKGITPDQENRGYNEKTGKTVLQRSKEDAHDYRYFPEPDIPPMKFTTEDFQKLKDQLPELPQEIVKRLVTDHGIKVKSAHDLVYVFGLELVEKFEKLVELEIEGQKVANILLNKKETHTLDPKEIKEKYLLKQEAIDASVIDETVEKIIKANPKAVEDFKNGKENSVQFLLGQVMRETKGKANPKDTISLIRQKLA